MNTLIIPCAGKSSRFPNMKPKFMLTHPDGKLMIEKAIGDLNLDIFDRVIITIVKPHDDQYECKLILEQCFAGNDKIEICILDNFTKSASETIALTLQKMHVTGAIVIKDSDNAVKIQLPKVIQNAVVGYDLHEHPNVSNIPGKSFLIINEQNLIQDIIEKQIVSNIICLGVYCFHDAQDFLSSYHALLKKNIAGEMFISHVISYMLAEQQFLFESLMAEAYQDWGTLVEWKQVQKAHRTYFVDVDGVLLKNCGKYGSVNWENNREVIPENLATIVELQKQGAQIVITTSRPESLRAPLEAILSAHGIKPYAILMGMNHAARVVMNDFAPTNPYPSGLAISLPRNALIKEYLN